MKKNQGILIVILILVGLSGYYFLVYKNKVDNSFSNEADIVKDYISFNIGSLVKERAVLGGSWHTVSIVIEAESNSGTVVYEDGHIQNSAFFTYSYDNKKIVINNFTVNGQNKDETIDGIINQEKKEVLQNQNEYTKPINQIIDFDKDILINLEKPVVYPDKLKIELISVNDSRCPKGAMCVWAGDLSAKIQVSGGELGNKVETLNLSMAEDKKAISVLRYIFILVDGGGESIILNIKNK